MYVCMYVCSCVGEQSLSKGLVRVVFVFRRLDYTLSEFYSFGVRELINAHGA